MKVAVLTIPAQQHRIWALMGHLDTLGFPVRMSPRISIYNGFDFKDYETRYIALQAMVKDGHIKYQSYLQGANEILLNLDSHGDMCEWGLLNILRKLVENNESALVIENDAFFRNLPVSKIEDSFEFLASQWRGLIDNVGYENINVAMFTVVRPDLDELKEKANLEDIDDFWVKGACGAGQTANIYTPHGAKMILEDKPCYPNIEAWLYYGDTQESDYGNIEGVYSSRDGIISLHFFSNFDSPHTGLDPNEAWQYYQGENL